MRILTFAFAIFTCLPLIAQSPEALYAKACGPIGANFTVEHVKEDAPSSPDAGKALVYVIQKGTLRDFFTRVGVDGAWQGAIRDNSYIPFSVPPGEHHLCVATTKGKHPEAEFLHFDAVAGQVYYFLVRGTSADVGNGIVMIFDPVDRDEARYLIASDYRSVAKLRP